MHIATNSKTYSVILVFLGESFESCCNELRRGAKNNGSGPPASFRCCGKFQPEGQVLAAGMN